MAGAGGRDTLHRRKRLSPISTGKRVTPQDRDFLWFEKLAEHGPLPSSFLLAFAANLRKCEKRARERLTDLFNEDNTTDGGPYLVRPPQQFRTLDSRYNQLVYDLAPAGRRALARNARSLPGQSAPSGPWLHGFMTSCVTASVELTTSGRSDISYIPQSRILARTNAELRYSVTIIDPVTKREMVKDLMPDALFGLEYHTDHGSRFRFFAVEADRATEPTTSANWNRKSFLRNLLQYDAYVTGGAYRRHLGLTAPLLVLTISSNAMRTARMAEFAAKRYPDGNSFMLFQTWPDFGMIFRPPQPNPNLLDGEWARGGLLPFMIGIL